MREVFQDELLRRHLRAYFGDIDDNALSLLQRRLAWVQVAAGQTLMTQGEPGDSMYLSVSGRLRAYVRDADGRERLVREMARGEIIGEMSLYTGAPRSATVVAIRDSVLVRLDKAAFDELLVSSAQVSIALTRRIIERLQTEPARTLLARPVAMALLPISAGVDAGDFAERLATPLRAHGRLCIVDAEAIDRHFARPGLARSEPGDAEHDRRIALHLDELEATHEFVLLVGDAQATAWSGRCCRRADELLLLADATQPPAVHDTERRFLMQREGRAEAAEILVLLHPEGTRCPRDTRAWLARRPAADHIHIRPALARDMARLARVQSGNAVGVVLAGGGARGLAHLGVLRALAEHGIEVDFVGGTSIGAVMAALAATDQPLDAVMATARRAFSENPTGDYNPVPLLSLIQGRRLKRVVAKAEQELLGADTDIEDLWRNFFCVASNYTRASEQVLDRGRLLKALLASIAIPGALPPVLHDGELLCDGGTFNNFPVDVMRARRGVGRVIGVDLSNRAPLRIEHDEVPSPWALLRDRLRPRRQRRYSFPSLVAYLMNVTVLYSTSRQREAQKRTDLYFNPPLLRVGMLQWHRFDEIVRLGHEHGTEVLRALPPQALAAFGIGAATSVPAATSAA